MPLHIQIKVKPNSMPTPEDLALHQRLEDMIIDEEIGDVLRTDASEGLMELFVDIDDEDTSYAYRVLQNLLKQFGVHMSSTIKVV